MGWNDASRMATVQALVESGEYGIDNTAHFFKYTGDKVKIGDKFYSDKPSVHPTLATLPYLALHSMDYTIKHHPRAIMYLTTVFISLLPFILFFLLFYKLSRNNYLDKRKNMKIFLLLCLASGSALISYTTVLNNHITAASLTGIALVMFYYLKTTKKNPFFIGFLLALATVMDPGVIFIISVFGLYLAYKLISNKDFKPLFFLVLGVVLPVVFHASITIPVTGDILPGSMHPEYFQYQGSAFGDHNLTGTSLGVNSFGEWVERLDLLLFSSRGFLSNNLTILFGLILSVYLLFRGKNSKTKTFAGLSLISASLVVAYYSLYGKEFFGGPNYLVRWFLVFIPMFLLIIFDWVDNKRKYLIASLVCLIMALPSIAATGFALHYEFGPNSKTQAIGVMERFPIYAGQQAEKWVKFIKNE